MAILSNINGKFAVDSTGAIQLSGSAGTANYVLVSGGAGVAASWYDIQGDLDDYLLLTGGTLTGNLSLTDASNPSLTVSTGATVLGGTLNVTGLLTGTTATFSGDVNITQTADVGVLNVANLDSGAAVGLSLTYPTTNVAAGDGLAIAIGIAGRGRSYIANSNVTTNLDASNLVFYTEDGGVIGERMIIDSAGAIQFNTYGSGTHTGTEAYTLGVDSSGNIIETASSGGGGGIFYGDQAIVTGSSDLTFTLTRATTGTLIFDVWFTSETSTATSLAKKYVVAHSHSTTPVYNKIIDTGPDGSNDFTVVFANSDTGAAGTSVTCSIQAVGIAQNIGYTIQVGHDSANALTFTAAS